MRQAVAEVRGSLQPEAATSQKVRGGYYTPAPISELLARWAIQSNRAQVLEPSCGDGVVAEAAARRLSGGSLVAVELDEAEARKAQERLNTRGHVVVGDFFTWYVATPRTASFDAVVGNPPFIRYQGFPEEHRTAAFGIMRQEGLRPSRLTNAWVPFVVAATAALRPGGRLALVVPAELLQVSYAGELREYLVRKYRRIVIVSFRQLLFPGTQQETLLLFGIRDDAGGARMKWIELDGLGDLGDIETIAATNGIPADLDHAREKWTQYYLTADELALIHRVEKSEAFVTLGSLASVDVGVVTGQNEFFVVAESFAAAHDLQEWCSPMVGRSSQIPGIRLTTGEWEALRSTDQKCFLVRMPIVPRLELPPAAEAYVASGEDALVHAGFKCRIRLPTWWSVPSVWTPEAFLLRQIHDGPRIVANNAGVTCTDTIHRLRLRQEVSPEALAAASLNSVTFAFAEIRGRSYGGGVLELEPSEAERLPFPRFMTGLPIAEIDQLVRARKTEEALDLVDRALLGSAGLTTADTAALRGIWRKLSQRRLGRRPIRAQAAMTRETNLVPA